jgi:alginate O-acetyltransferase complex protein AlgI
MLFSSVIFLFFFFPVVLALYFLPPQRYRNSLFICASLVFYAWSEGQYLLVLVLFILCNYLLGLWLNATTPDHSPYNRCLPGSSAPRPSIFRSRKVAFVCGITLNVLILGIFKYTNFVAANLNALAKWFNLPPVTVASVYAPLGISFLCFHALSYIIDCYRRDAPVLKNPGALALYLAAFPKILAGPIVPYQDAARQLDSRSVTGISFLYGIERFVTGLAKKVLVANPLAVVADSAFGLQAGDLSLFSAWTGIVCFTLQIYFDFSGYTDMAIGLGKMFGFDFPENFNFPYISQSVREFWQRWHISLSLWFRNYLYIPLGGNRSAPSRTYFNLVVVFILCGLWHGASWNFIFWGAWYGLFLVLERTRLGGNVLQFKWRPLRHVYLLFVVILGWVFFRADSLPHALAYIKAMFGFSWAIETPAQFAVHLSSEILLLIPLATLLCLPISSGLKTFGKVALKVDSVSGIASYSLYTVYTAVLGALFLVSCMALAGGTHKAFIYFKF